MRLRRSSNAPTTIMYQVVAQRTTAPIDVEELAWPKAHQRAQGLACPYALNLDRHQEARRAERKDTAVRRRRATPPCDAAVRRRRATPPCVYVRILPGLGSTSPRRRMCIDAATAAGDSLESGAPLSKLPTIRSGPRADERFSAGYSFATSGVP